MAIELAATLVKVLSAGHSAWQAWCEDGIGGEELKALRFAVGAAQSGVKLARGASPAGGAQYLALGVLAFGEAYRRHWGGGRTLTYSGVMARFNRLERDRVAELQARLLTADLKPPSLGEGPTDVAADDRHHARAAIRAQTAAHEQVSAILGHPLQTEVYTRLWWVMTDPALTGEGEETPLEPSAAARRAFESAYLRAWWEGLSSPGGAGVRAWLRAAEVERGALVRALVLADMARWDTHHVFSNVAPGSWHGSRGPLLPLGRMYVEPSARASEADAPTGVQAQLDAWLGSDTRPHVLVVKGDFGRGKSLSARRLAQRLASRQLDDANTPSPRLWRPVFVQCARDLNGAQATLRATVRNALKRHAERVGLPVDLEHPGCQLDPTERTLIILDGLDEVLLGQSAIEDLFRRLGQQASHLLRVAVFTRPGVLPSRLSPEDVRVLELQPFEAPQIERWLTAWNALTCRAQPITRAALAERDLEALAATPILLFMIATTWDEAAGSAEWTQAWLYESFMMHIARGKHADDREHHPTVFGASEALRAGPRAWDAHAEPLLGGRLLEPGDKSFEFLEQMLRGRPERGPFQWSHRRRETLRQWAEDRFNDEAFTFSSDRHRTLRADRSAVIREAALAIGSRIAWMDDTPGLRARSRATLTSMLAWFWAADTQVRLIACRAVLQGKLGSIRAPRSDFRGAVLDECDLVQGDFSGSRFDGASLLGADLRTAGLFDCTFTGADLRTAYLAHAYLAGAVFRDASLADADFDGAHLFHTDLAGVKDLDEALNLRGAHDLDDAILPEGFTLD